MAEITKGAGEAIGLKGYGSCEALLEEGLAGERVQLSFDGQGVSGRLEKYDWRSDAHWCVMHVVSALCGFACVLTSLCVLRHV